MFHKTVKIQKQHPTLHILSKTDNDFLKNFNSKIGYNWGDFERLITISKFLNNSDHSNQIFVYLIGVLGWSLAS